VLFPHATEADKIVREGRASDTEVSAEKKPDAASSSEGSNAKSTDAVVAVTPKLMEPSGSMEKVRDALGSIVQKAKKASATDLSPRSEFQKSSKRLDPRQALISHRSPIMYFYENSRSMARTDCDVNGVDSRAVMIAVISSPGHVRARDAIRDTWGKEAKYYGIPVKFFVGQLPEANSELESRLSAESDVVRCGDFTESYHNLTTKALDVYAFAHQQCFAGVFKVDDDSYVRVGYLLDFLDHQADLVSMYAGMFIVGAPVMKNPEGRWYAFDQYPHDSWPQFANGPGIFLGSRALKYINDNREVLPHIRIDDSAVGVWTKDLEMNMVPMPGSILEYTPKTDVVFQNPLEPDEMLRVHKGQVFTPKACHYNTPFSCRCEGHPDYSVDGISDCWIRMGNSSYVDISMRAH